MTTKKTASKNTSFNQNFPALLTNFVGKPVQGYTVEASVLPKASAQPAPAHHILIIDRSGSMWGEIPEVNNTIEKTLTLQEAKDSKLIVSVISYSSKGDVTVHANRVPVANFMASRSPELAAVRKIQATGLTCISQSIGAAKGLIKAGETTCVTLHSDGYANDPSPGTEMRDLMTGVKDLRSHPRTFVNTIAYNSYSDFKTLSALAAEGGGQCFASPTAAELLKSLTKIQKSLAGSLQPTLEISRGAASIVLARLSDGRVLMTEQDTLRIDGLPADGTGTVWRLTKAPANAPSSYAEQGPLFLAMAEAALSNQKIDVCKYAMVSSCIPSLRDPKLLRAMAGPDLAELAAALQGITDSTPDTKLPRSIQSDAPSFLDLADFIEKHKEHLSVDGPSLVAGYNRIGVKDLQGSRDKKTGAFTPARAQSRVRDTSGWWPVSGLNANIDSANLNLLTVQPIDVLTREGTVLSEVAGRKLTDMKQFRNYSLVADGSVTVKSLRLRASSPSAKKALAKFGTVDSDGIATLALDTFPVVSYDQGVPRLPRHDLSAYRKLLAIRKIAEAVKKAPKAEGTGTLSGDQIKALGEYHITPGMNFSPPSATPYTDLKAALAEGSIDTRISYKVQVGDTSILSTDELPSANKFLDRRFELVGSDESPTFDKIAAAGTKLAVKKLSSKVKITAVDEQLMPLYEHLLGLAVTRDDPMAQLFSDFDFTFEEQADLRSFITVGTATDGDKVARVIASLDEAIIGFRRCYLQPLALYVGSSGILPTSYAGGSMLTAEQLEQKYPQLKIGSDQKDGTFFVYDDHLVVGVFPESNYFSTTKPA